MAELMVALMILSVVSLILSGLIPATIVGMAKAAKRANAGIIADKIAGVPEDDADGDADADRPDEDGYDAAE